MPAEYKIRTIIGVSGRHRRSLMKNHILSNAPPCEGYIVEIDGKFESEYGTLMGGIESRLGTQGEVSARPGQSARRKRANADGGRTISVT